MRIARQKSGVVLVMALLMLAVMMLLLLALFEGATHQTRGSQGDVATAREKMLAETAVGLVIGQIEQATAAQPSQTWMSQPGLLRTYSCSAATRTPTACFKLYSTASPSSMIDKTGTLNFLATDVPPNWAAQPAAYTDLNAAAQTPGLFPTTLYPIFNPGAESAVQGVSVDSGHVAEMPVAWLYEMQDGTLGPASLGTAANPIVARIAFWTDDETSKIDINTAGCGDGWNAPHLYSTDDQAWAAHQPVGGEYSSYPGHPATTSLNVVFGNAGVAATSQLAQEFLGMSPRYAWGGSQFGTQATTPGTSPALAPKTDRLYASVDELCFSSTTTNGQRVANPVTASQVDMARFVLTAHSESPETTIAGEPRVAIWPVADAAANRTAADRAIASAATVGTGTSGTRNYYFQRNNPLNPLDDFATTPAPVAPSATWSNVTLFNDLLNRGKLSLPGCTQAFTAKYSGAKWTQIMLEIADFIHGLNSIDATAGSMPFAPSAANGIGRGFVDPLTTSYVSGTNTLTLRGFGRCPTLSSLTVVFYVSGFGFKSGTKDPTGNPNPAYIDYTETPDNRSGTGTYGWTKYFYPASPDWANVNSERIRAFVVPCTFHPGCGYPEVSDACTVQITGLSNVQVSAPASPAGGFSFPDPAISGTLGAPFRTLPAERGWGGNEGPLAWLGTADALASGTMGTYPFTGPYTGTSASSGAYSLVVSPGSPNGRPPAAWPTSNKNLTFNVTNLTVTIGDVSGNALQTLNVQLPAFTVPAPTINYECGQADQPPPTTSDPNWTSATDSSCTVPPSWYMSLGHRLQTWSSSRGLMVQAGDVVQSVEAKDLRVNAALSTVPFAMFAKHPNDNVAPTGLPNGAGAHAFNLRFADGTSPCFAPGPPVSGKETMNYVDSLAATPAPTTSLLTVTDWHSSSTATYNYFSQAPCSVPTGSDGIFSGTSIPGDWDTGPGLEPDGALINLPDAGTSMNSTTAYFSLSDGQANPALQSTQRTPNALVPSPVIFGSLPSGVNPTDALVSGTAAPTSVPWQTLLFCPYPASNTPSLYATCAPYSNHAGATSPPDYYILDNFWMPVIEPYAISTCMTTAGKVNLNDQIVPFTYIHRSTALRALLDDLRIPAIPAAVAGSYKTAGTPINTANTPIWNAVDEDSTVAQIENKFAGGSVDAYLSESEICAVPLVPKFSSSPFSTNVAATQTALASFWGGSWASTTNPDGSLTGDNLRELPYAQLYGRLTTRSNSYTVHIRVQVLKKLTNDPNQNVWNEGTDVVLGDWRGSYEIERYLDPNASAPAAGSPLGPYKFRIVSSHAFVP